MPASGMAAGGGFRRAMLFELKANGLPIPPAVAGATAQTYIHLVGGKTFSPTYPEPVIITHTGDDGVLGQIMLPPNETVAGTMTTGTTNLVADALLTGANVVNIGDMASLGRAIVPQTYPQVGVIAYRQAVVTDPTSANKGKECWVWAQMPIAKVAPRAGTMEEGGADENTYNILPQTVGRYLWGTAFATGTEGFLNAQIVYGVSWGQPVFCSWLIDAVPTLTLDLPTSALISEDGTNYAVKVWRWNNSTGAITDVTSTATLTDPDEVVLAAGPVENDMIYCFYEAVPVY